MSIYLWIFIFSLYIIFCRYIDCSSIENRSLPGGYLIYQFIVYLRVLFKPNIKKVSDGTISFWLSLVDSEMDFIVWFCDIDNYGHMNNSNYNLYCDYGRYNYAIRMFGYDWLGKAYCVVGASNIQYLRSFKLFQKFTLRTSVVAVRGKNVWFRQSYFLCFYS